MSRITIELDGKLVAEGMKLSGFKTKHELVNAALTSFLHNQQINDILSQRVKIKKTHTR